jgi:hypothetical protein
MRRVDEARGEIKEEEIIKRIHEKRREIGENEGMREEGWIGPHKVDYIPTLATTPFFSANHFSQRIAPQPRACASKGPVRTGYFLSPTRGIHPHRRRSW